LDALHSLNFLHLKYFWTVAREGSVAAACKQLHVAQPTVSMQIRKLEKTLGHKLFERQGRGLILTDEGRMVLEYAEDIFSLGREMMGAVRGAGSGRQPRLLVGVPKVMPKLITYRLLEPVLAMPEPIRIICEEGELDQLVGDLATHRYDVILSDVPIAPRYRVKLFSHPLGESSVTLCAHPSLAERYREGFPKVLHQAPFLLPTANTELRRAVDRWFETWGVDPQIVAEFDDSALLKEFGFAGAGVMPVPSVVLTEVKQQYGVDAIAELPDVKTRFFAITTQRKLTHPAVSTIAEAAKRGLLAGSGSGSTAGNKRRRKAPESIAAVLELDAPTADAATETSPARSA
jgi:LysR family transcriptional regulator, transcriptional activator of nhaA